MKQLRLSKLVYLSCAIVACMCVAIIFAAPTTAEAASSNPQKMYRIYNQWSGEHLYTQSENERNVCTKGGWTYEGIGWYAPQTSDVPVYRLYNPYSGDHHYTTDKTEYTNLQKGGWRGEDIAFYSEPESQTDRVKVYRQYNPYAPMAYHNFTTKKKENDDLVNAGWIAEGIGWYGVNYTDTSSLYLGSFFVDVEGGSGRETVLCTSRDGVEFEKVKTVFNKNQNSLRDPSIMYRDGKFWMISNWYRSESEYQGKFWPIVSFSYDLKTWSEPEGFQLIDNGKYNGIPVSSYPYGIKDFDVVAPEWFVDDNGDCYIVFSAGYYGAFHGQAENDRMKNYIVKVNPSASGMTGKSVNNNPYPSGLTLGVQGSAYELQGMESGEFGDSSIYKENGSYYLITKKNGVNNQIYKNSAIKATGWTKVNGDLGMGTEGPCVIKQGNSYIMYTDKIDTWYGVNGMQFSIGSSLTGAFSPLTTLGCKTADGQSVKLRHGTVIDLGKIGGNAKQYAENLRKSAGFN